MSYEPMDGFGVRQDESPLGFIAEEKELWRKAETSAEREHVLRLRNARRLREHKEREARQWRQTQAGQLLKQLGEAFEAYRAYVAQDPEAEGKALEFDEANQKLFNKMKSTMERAHAAARCRYLKANGGTCRAPRVRGEKYCHMHLMMEEARPEKIKLPNLADANGIHAAIAKGAQAVVDGKLDQKQAAILGYYLQLAVTNVGRVKFEEERMVEG